MNKESISDVVKKNLNKRYKREARFKRLGQFSIFVASAFLVIFFFDIITKGYTAFNQSQIFLELELKSEYIDPENTGDIEEIRYGKIDIESHQNYHT